MKTLPSSNRTPRALRPGDFVIKKSWLRVGFAALIFLMAAGLAVGLMAAVGWLPNLPALTGTPPAAAAYTPASIGPSSAKVTVTEFADFYCEYCKQFHDQTLSALLQHYGNKIRYVYYDFPTSGGSEAAAAANCAKEQGSTAYWSYHNALFSNPYAYSNAADFNSLASSLNLDAGKFSACVQSGRYRDAVNQSYNLGIAYGVRATPTFLINNMLVIGAQPLSTFESVIDAQLGG